MYLPHVRYKGSSKTVNSNNSLGHQYVLNLARLSTTASAARSKTMIKWTQRNNQFIISLLAEGHRAVDMLTRLSGKEDRRMWMWEEGQGMGCKKKNLEYYLVCYERCMKQFNFPAHHFRKQLLVPDAHAEGLRQQLKPFRYGSIMR